MVRSVEKLTGDSDDSAIFLDRDLEVPDLQGEHLSQVTYLERRVSQHGKNYFTLGVQIVDGPCAGESVFGRVYPGESLRQFLDVCGVTPDGDNALLGEDIIGAKLVVVVGTTDVRRPDGRTETQFVITGIKKASIA